MIDVKVTISLSNADYKLFKSIAFDKYYAIIKVGSNTWTEFSIKQESTRILKRFVEAGLIHNPSANRYKLTEAGKYLWAKG